jgi:hypothetical protein
MLKATSLACNSITQVLFLEVKMLYCPSHFVRLKGYILKGWDIIKSLILEGLPRIACERNTVFLIIDAL